MYKQQKTKAGVAAKMKLGKTRRPKPKWLGKQNARMGIKQQRLNMRTLMREK